ncbi:methyltransferase domain-containing protein [Flavobacterium sp.]|uniref:methyltransferase domain-containing protein n=1 Tax=Flavobacterium sp. TaxID=239 RepID=UPI00286AA6CF|nr:methyltransferase domain-containing protein [Flavobacterium sp.]
MYDKNEYQIKYQSLTFEDKLRKYRMEYIVDYLKTIKSNKILEIGCGNDPIFAQFDDYEVMDIVEPGNHFYESTKNRIGDNKRVSIQNCFIEEATLDLKNQYDVIVIGGFLHEIDNPQEVLSVIKKIATSETIVITYVPNANSFHRLLALESGLIKSNYEFSKNDQLFGRQNVFNQESIGALFQNTGFNVLQSSTYFVKPFTHEQMDALAGLPSFSEKILDGFYKMTKYMPDLGCEIFLAARLNA